MKEMKVISCALCPFVIDGSKYTFPECSLSERDPDDGLKKGVPSRVEAPIPDWCPLRKSPMLVKV